MPNGQQAPPPQVVIPGAGWVDVATKAITQVGFPVVIAGVLLWFLLTKFQSNMDLITRHMTDNTQTITTFISQQKAELEEVTRQSGEMKEQTQTLQEIAGNLRVLLAHRQAGGATP